MTDTVRLHLGKLTGALTVLSGICGLVWLMASWASRIEAAERVSAQHEQWIGQQTVRIEKLESALIDMRITLGRIDENVQQLRRENRVRN
jgi:uncharacterized circularly permuted ATP-grasp superfamily protein